jgi:predicted PurR-regulated permease PerM
MVQLDTTGRPEAPIAEAGAMSAEESAGRERRALGVLALLALAVIAWLMSPVAMGMLVGVMLAFTARPTFERLSRRFRPSIAALATVLTSTFALVLIVGGIVGILVRDGATLGRAAAESLGPGGGAKKLLLALSGLTSRVGVSQQDLTERAHALVLGIAGRAESVAQAVASATASMVAALFFMMLTMYFVLSHWQLVLGAAEDTLPLRPEHTRKLFDEFRRVGRATLLSTIVLGVLQAALAVVGYAIVGLPKPLFFGALTALASLVPGLGTLLVWVPAAIVLIAGGRTGAGIFLLAWGVFVLTAIPDYVIRPRLVGRDAGLPALFTFVALIGGAAVLGLKGLILGPVLMTMAMAVLRLYREEARASRPAHG